MINYFILSILITFFYITPLFAELPPSQSIAWWETTANPDGSSKKVIITNDGTRLTYYRKNINDEWIETSRKPPKNKTEEPNQSTVKPKPNTNIAQQNSESVTTQRKPVKAPGKPKIKRTNSNSEYYTKARQLRKEYIAEKMTLERTKNEELSKLDREQMLEKIDATRIKDQDGRVSQWNKISEEYRKKRKQVRDDYYSALDNLVKTYNDKCNQLKAVYSK
jgi:hypothetical protein